MILIVIDENCCNLNVFSYYSGYMFHSWTLTFKKIFTKSKFSPVLFEKNPSFVCLVFKIENK